MARIDSARAAPIGALNPRSEAEADGALLFEGRAYRGSTPLAEVVRQADQRAAAVVFVNGIVTPLAHQWMLHHALAQATGAPVVAVHNGSFGLVRDALDAARSAFGGANPATHTLVPLLMDALREERPLRLVGASQGALVISAAVERARRQALELWPPAEVDRRFARLTVETLGAPAPTRGWATGPRWRHYVNPSDPVARLSPTRAGEVISVPGPGSKGSYVPSHSPLGYFPHLANRGGGWKPPTR